MSTQSFGSILRQQRELRGISLAQAAETLRIRPDVLRSIEEADFYRMPPRGFTRNMINSYARMLGLNATELTRMYLEDAHAYEVEQSRGDRVFKNSSYSTRLAARIPRATSGSNYAPNRPLGRNREGGGETRASGRRLYSVDGTRNARSGSMRSSYANGDSMHRTRRGGQDAQRRQRRREESDGGTGTRVRTQSYSVPNVHSSDYMNDSKRGSGSKSMLVLIAIVIAIIVVASIVFNLVLKPSSKTDIVTTIPISGLNDPESSGVSTTNKGSATETETATTTAPEPTSVKVSYSVDADEVVYIEFSVDGDVLTAETITGPEEKSADVSGTADFLTTDPSVTHVYVGGKEVAPTGDETTGVYSYSFDFDTYLDEWREENKAASAATQASGQEASSQAG